jgi:outer membrane protein TolC
MMVALLGLQLAVAAPSTTPAPPAPPALSRLAEEAERAGEPVATQDSVPTLTLAEALQRATKLNPDYVRALGSVSEADWARKAARIAFFAPSLTASVDLTKYDTKFFNFGTLQLSNTSVTGHLDARYELFSMRKFAELGRTQAELEGATATEVQQRFAAALLTESAFYGVLADDELARVADERATRAEEQLRLARARVASGAAVQSDSLTVRLELLRSRVDVLRTQSSLRVARLELGRRVGVAGPVNAAPLPADQPPSLPISQAEAIAQALEQGPEYRAARASERAAEAQLRGKRGAYLPTVTLTGSHTRFDTQFFPDAKNVSSITLNVTLPLWNNGDRELAIIQSRSVRDVARALRSDLERAALRDVTEAYDGYETARAAVGLASEGVVVAGENYRVQEARYKAGATTVLDLLTAQNGLSEAEAGLVQARYAARLALARLEAILGTRFATTNGGSQ